jgi:hypothetical protein
MKNIKEIIKKINPFYYYVIWIIIYLLMLICKYNFTFFYYVIESIEMFSRGILIVMFLTFFNLEWVKKHWKFTVFVNSVNLLILIINLIYIYIYFK